MSKKMIVFIERDAVLDLLRDFRVDWVEAAGDLSSVTLDLSMFFDDLVNMVKRLGEEPEIIKPYRDRKQVKAPGERVQRDAG